MNAIPDLPPEREDGLATDTIVSVERAFAILEALARSPGGLTFVEIRRVLGVNQGICFKLLTTLERSSYVFRHEGTGRYQLTFKVSNLSMTRLSNARLLDLSTATLRTLADATGELARLAVVERDNLTWVLSVAGQKREQHALQLVPINNFRIGLNTHASGKAWLSTLSVDRVKELLDRHGIESRTPFSKTTVDEILADIAESARRGFAITFEENEINIGAIAAPIVLRALDGTPRCVGTVSLAAPTSRLSRGDLERNAPVVITAANKLAESWPLANG